MGWFTAAKTLFDDDLRKVVLVIIAILIAIPLTFPIIALPVLILNLPITSFQEKGEADQTIQDYITIMVDYKYKIHDKVKSMKREYNANGYEIRKVKINYPSLSVLMAYDNVINKTRYTDESIKVLLNKNEIFSFLDKCMNYHCTYDTAIADIKSPEEIAKSVFSDEDDINMFTAIYETLRKTDLDSSVPEVKFSDLEYLEGGIELPYINQGDDRWRNKPYGSSTIGKSGCAIASLSMVINGLLPESDVLPPELANWAASNGYYISGAGTSWSFFQGVANKYNLKMRNLSRDNPQEILDELGKGHPVVVSMSAGHFTKGGHIMVLRGVTDDGKILVSDPASLERSNQSWDYSIILLESSTLSPSCFWSYSK